MGRLLTIGLCGLLAFATPVFAQSTGPQGVSQGRVSQGSVTSPRGVAGGTAYAEDKKDDSDTAALLIGGAVVLGGAALIAVAVSNNHNDHPISP